MGFQAPVGEGGPGHVVAALGPGAVVELAPGGVGLRAGGDGEGGALVLQGLLAGTGEGHAGARIAQQVGVLAAGGDGVEDDPQIIAHGDADEGGLRSAVASDRGDDRQRVAAHVGEEFCVGEGGHGA